MNLKITALVVVAMAATAFVTLNLKDTPQTITKVEVVERFIPAPPSAQAADTEMAMASPLGQPLAAQPAAAVPTHASEFGVKLLTAKDVRAFVDDALRHPEKGGGFYTLLALRQCENTEPKDSLVQQVVSRDSTISTELLNKIEFMNARCADLTKGEIARLRAQANALKGDPLIKLQREMTETKAGTLDRDKVLAAMFAGNTAQAAENFVALRLLQQSMSMSEDGQTMTYRFNGKAYSDPQDGQAIHLATMMYACTGEDFCSIDALMTDYCRNSAICYTSREQFLREGWLKDNPAMFDRTAQFAQVIREAAARGDTSIFK